MGRLKAGPERALVDDYAKRAAQTGRAIGFPSVSEVEVDNGGGVNAEGAKLLAKIPKGARAFRLDENGEAIGSAALAKSLGAWRDAGERDLVWLIGGAEGYSDDVKRAAPNALAFGPQTWPHRLVRVMAFEQLYRAVSILAGAPYHKT